MIFFLLTSPATSFQSTLLIQPHLSNLLTSECPSFSLRLLPSIYTHFLSDLYQSCDFKCHTCSKNSWTYISSLDVSLDFQFRIFSCLLNSYTLISNLYLKLNISKLNSKLYPKIHLLHPESSHIIWRPCNLLKPKILESLLIPLCCLKSNLQVNSTSSTSKHFSNLTTSPCLLY